MCALILWKLCVCLSVHASWHVFPSVLRSLRVISPRQCTKSTVLASVDACSTASKWCIRDHPHMVWKGEKTLKQMNNPRVLKTLRRALTSLYAAVCFNLQVNVSWTLSAVEAFTFCSQRRKCVPPFPPSKLWLPFQVWFLHLVSPPVTIHFTLHLSVFFSIFSSALALCLCILTSALPPGFFLCRFLFSSSWICARQSFSQCRHLSGPVSLRLSGTVCMKGPGC